jgi:signal recognition particle receptor subunit beta
MVQINFGQREVSCKIVFYGPGMSGKTTNLEIIHQKAPKQAVGEMVSIATETDRTLYFDFMPMDLGQVAGMHTKFMLYTVPGQIYYNATRKLVLQGVDGVIFVADSDPKKMAENIEAIQNLRDNLAEMGLKPEDLPLVLQYNKRDLPNVLTINELNAKLNTMNAPVFEAVAKDGKGVFATLKEVSRLVIEKLNKEHAPASNRRRTAASLTPPQNSASTSAAAPIPAAPAPAPFAAQAASAAQAAAPAAKATMRPPGSGSSGMNPQPIPKTQLKPPSGTRPAAHSTGSGQAPVANQDNARERHLAKSKPPALAERRGGHTPDLGSTDPMLKRYQMARQSGTGMMGMLLMVMVGLVISLLLLAILTLFVRPVRDLLPAGLREKIENMVGDKSTQAAPADATSKPVTTAAAPEKPAAVAPEAPAPAAKPVAPEPEKPAALAPVAPVEAVAPEAPAPEAPAPAADPVAPAPEQPAAAAPPTAQSPPAEAPAAPAPEVPAAEAPAAPAVQAQPEAPSTDSGQGAANGQ